MSDIKRILEHFNTITSIPHCSKHTKALQEYIINFAREQGYSVELDEAKNILISIGNPKLCLQGHYDMVCVGDAPNIELESIDGWLSAKNSSLGADNGIAIAMMMALMQDSLELEFLLTSDEEIGLVGAKELNLNLKSSRLLNLDYEDEGIVCIGCAGGVDLIGRKESKIQDKKSPVWEVSISGLPGGHSGVDIDKDIPNAIKELSYALMELDNISLVSFVGGERRNSIPVGAKAIILSENRPSLDDRFDIEELGISTKRVLIDSRSLLRLLATAPNGVISYNQELKIPQDSLNLAKVDFNSDFCQIDYSLRSMSMEGLNSLSTYTNSFLKRYAFEVEYQEEYPAWKPEMNLFTQDVAIALKEVFGISRYEAIHAGLECGVLSQKYPNISIASMGPSIENPHSIRERVNIDSIEKSFEALCKIVSRHT